MTPNDIAKTCHELNKAYCEATGDNSQPSWEEAPEWQKNSAIAGVNMHLNNPDATPTDSHNSWLKQKEEEGWKYGPTKNPETKEHPCFVPYDQLPESQKAKDYIFRQTVHSLKPFLSIVGMANINAPIPAGPVDAVKIGSNIYIPILAAPEHFTSNKM